MSSHEIPARKERKRLILMSLVSSACVFVFFLLAPALGYPLAWEQSIRLIELIVPVFVGYLGAAAHYIFQSTSGSTKVAPMPELASLVTFGPLLVFLIGSGVVLFVFGYTNRSSAFPGTGMNIDVLSAIFTALLGLLTVTTSVAISYFFSLETRNDSQKSLKG